MIHHSRGVLGVSFPITLLHALFLFLSSTYVMYHCLCLQDDADNSKQSTADMTAFVSSNLAVIIADYVLSTTFIHMN